MRLPLLNEKLMLHPLGTGELIKLHISVQMLALWIVLDLRLKTKDKIQRGEVALHHFSPQPSLLYLRRTSTVHQKSAEWASKSLNSWSRILSRDWGLGQAQELSEQEGGYFPSSPFPPFALPSYTSQEVPKEDKRLSKWACWGGLFIVLFRGLYKK